MCGYRRVRLAFRHSVWIYAREQVTELLLDLSVLPKVLLRLDGRAEMGRGDMNRKEPFSRTVDCLTQLHVRHPEVPEHVRGKPRKADCGRPHTSDDNTASLIQCSLEPVLHPA